MFSKINRCYNKGDMYIVNGNYVGGVAGTVYANSDIYNVYNLGKIEGDSIGLCGGIFGEIWSLEDTEYVNIYNVYNAGKIIVDATTATGGIGSTATISTAGGNIRVGNGFNIGNITVKDTTFAAELIFSINNDQITKKMYYISRKLLPSLPNDIDNFIPKTAAEINSQAFVDELNENIKDMPECVKWKLGTNGYPVLDM